MKTLICSCNDTLPLDGRRLSQALDGPDAPPMTVHRTLCRREAGAFQRAALSGDDLVVACTQEQRLFLALNAETEGAPGVQERPIRFVNIRETAGWSAQADQATPKIAALLAAARLPDPEPVGTVAYESAGRCLVTGPLQAAEDAAALLHDVLDVTVLATDAQGTIAQRHDHAVHRGELVSLTGWLGAFEARWDTGNPIDLDLCTRCNACVAACPEGAIDFSYQVDLSRCRDHRDCVRVCESAGAIDFTREPVRHEERFDLVLDLHAQPVIALHQPPQGYVHVPAAPQAGGRTLMQAVTELRERVGRFEKPRFFRYKASLCAHSRNEQVGCRACIDVCSAQAVVSLATEGGGIQVEPHLCVGCGACTTVCPSGALGYAYPNTVDQGKRIRTLLQTYHRTGGPSTSGAAAVLLHSEARGVPLIEELGRRARVDRAVGGMPARVLPLAVWHTASTGLDLWLAAIAYGAADVWILLTGEEAPDYRLALTGQVAVANTLLTALGYGVAGAGQAAGPVRLIEARDVQALDAALRSPPGVTAKQAAGFAVQADKRATLDLALDHLLRQAPVAVQEVVLPGPAPGAGASFTGSPWGSVQLDTQRCTLCMSCVGACPESALMDNPDAPQLRFVEANCVQCGLCVTTCPEDALALQPRLWLAQEGQARKQPRVLFEAQPYRCIRCQKPFGTLQAVERMLGRLQGHPAFQGSALERLRMCSDCRVVDIFDNPGEVRITDL